MGGFKAGKPDKKVFKSIIFNSIIGFYIQNRGRNAACIQVKTALSLI
jgi:hypothetical protein